MRDDLSGILSPRLAEILVHALLAGGKRVRPLLTLLCGRLCGAPQEENLYRLATATEYIHAASLLHDDVIDHSEQRRGRPTANHIWGSEQAILAGDFLHARAMLLAGSIGGIPCLASLSKAAEAMAEAEFLQMKTAAAGDTDEDQYFSVLKGKTAALIASACEMAALYSGAADNARDALYLYGSNLGIAFQIVDDLLDYLGNPAKTGKQVGNDFQEGKMTLPLIHAIRSAETADKLLLQKLLQSVPEKRREALTDVIDIIKRYNGFDYAQKRAAALIEEAVDSLAVLRSGIERETLSALARYVLLRDK